MKKRLWRTVGLGVIALAAMLYALIFILDNSLREASALFIGSIIIVLISALSGLLIALCFWAIKWLFKK